MARIPGVEELGRRPGVQAGTSIASIGNAGAIGNAVAQAGQIIGGVVEQYQQEKRVADVGVADAGNLKEISDLERSFDVDGDYATQGERFEQGAEALRQKWAATIRDNPTRERWLQQSRKEGIAARDRVFTRGMAGERQQTIVKTDTALDTYAQVLSDPDVSAADRERAKTGAVAAIDAGEKSGQYSPAEAQARREAYIRGSDFVLGKRILEADPEAISGGYLDRLRRQENAGGSNTASPSTSSALGRYQFTTDTWAGVAKNHPELGLTPDGRTDPAQQERAIRAFTGDNEAVLKRNGVPVNDKTRYLAHFLGAGGAVTLWSTMLDTPDMPAASVFGGAAKANPTIFYTKDGRPRSISEVYDLQTKRFGGEASPVTQPDWYKSLTPEQQFSLQTFADARQKELGVQARAGIETVMQDAPAAIQSTGGYSGQLPGPGEFHQAWGPVEGQQRYERFQASVDTSHAAFDMRTDTPAEIAATVAAAKPTEAGSGAALAADRYNALSAAAEQTIKARQADPVAYVRSAFPAVNAAWQSAQPGTDSYRQALAVTAAAQQQIGLAPQDMKLVPTDIAKRAADTFKSADLPEAQRVGAIAQTIFATNDPQQQSAIFRQLVDAGLPDTTEGAVRAYARGDQAAADRLMRASIINPKDLPGKIAESEDKIQQSIQDEIMADGEVGDLFYGLSYGQTENLVSAERDGKLLTKAVQLRMAGGETMDAAVAGAKKDLYGPVKAVSADSVDALIPDTADATTFADGAAALLPQVEAAVLAGAPPMPDGTTGAAKSLIAATVSNTVKNIVAQGAFRNATGGFSFVDPYTLKAVQGKDGKPITFTLDQILEAGKASANSRTGDPLANANNPGSRFNQARDIPPAPVANEPVSPPMPSAEMPATAAPLSLQEQLTDAQRSAVSAAVRAISNGADPKAITARLRDAGVPKELWPE